MNKSINLRIFPVDEEIIEKMKAEGRPVAETIRSLIREFGFKHYPPEPGYVEAKKAELELKKKETGIR